MFKKMAISIFILIMIFSMVGCGDQEEDPDEGIEEDEALEKEKEEAQEEPVGEEKEDQEKEERAEELLDDIESKWTAEIDFEVGDLKDWLFTEEQVHFFYENEGALFYQSLDLNSGEELTNKKVEGAPTPEDFEISRDISFELHEFNGRVYGIIGQNDIISEEGWDQLPKALQQEQRMMIVDLDNNETILSKTPMIENVKRPDIGITGERNIYPGFLFDVTADGRYVMILNSVPGMSLWENHLNFSTDQNQEELEEKNKEVLKQFEDAPLWVYDLQEDELLEIPYKDSIDALVPYHVQGLENGINMIFTEQEGWLILDIKEETVEKTGEGGVYRRTEPRVPGVEQYRDGEIVGENLFFTDVQETAEGIGAVPMYHHLWDFSGEGLEFSGMIGPNPSTKSFYFNNQTEEIIVNTSKGQEGEELIEKIYRLSFDEERLKDNQGSEPVESLIELEGMEVEEKMEFPQSGEEASQGRLSISGHGVSARPIKDFQHLGYGILSGANLNQPSQFEEAFYYVSSNAAEEEVLKVGYGNLLLADSTQILFFKGNQMKVYDLDEFFGGMER